MGSSGLNLSWCKLTKQQFLWLIKRLPQLRKLHLQGCGEEVISALQSCTCPPLTQLDISWNTNISDQLFISLFHPPPDSLPGLINAQSRLTSLTHLYMAGLRLHDDSTRL